MTVFGEYRRIIYNYRRSIVSRSYWYKVRNCYYDYFGWTTRLYYPYYYNSYWTNHYGWFGYNWFNSYVYTPYQTLISLP